MTLWFRRVHFMASVIKQTARWHFFDLAHLRNETSKPRPWTGQDKSQTSELATLIVLVSRAHGAGILIAASKDTQWYILWAYVSAFGTQA